MRKLGHFRIGILLVKRVVPGNNLRTVKIPKLKVLFRGVDKMWKNG
jgi:hypothetical protein